MNFSILIRQVLSSICYDSQNEECLLRKCVFCKGKTIDYLAHEADSIIHLKQWVTEKEQRISGKTKKNIIVQRTVKKFLYCSVCDIKKNRTSVVKIHGPFNKIRSSINSL